ncbi:MAG: chromate resistance protein ChrB domain-containing protein [bacterium]
MLNKVSIGIILLLILLRNGYAETFSTWKGMELDKCASIWLIKNYVDKSAVIKFYPRDTFKMDGTSFDVPVSDLRSREGKSTFTHILEKYKINNSILNIFKKIIQDIETNISGDKVTSESAGLNAIVNGIIVSSKSNDEIMGKSFVVFDGLYADIENRLKKR